MRSDNLRALSAPSLAHLQSLGLQLELVAIDLDGPPRASADVVPMPLQDRIEEARRLLRVEGADISAVASIAHLTEQQVRMIRWRMGAKP